MQAPIKEYEDVLAFGKYKGKTVDWVAEKNPGYIVWLAENRVCEVDEKIYDAAMMDDMNSSPPEDYFWVSD